MERYNLTIKENPFDGGHYADTEVSVEGEYIRYADAQAQLEAVRRERDEAIKRSSSYLVDRNALRNELETEKRFTNRYIKRLHRAEAQLEAERTRREQVEMANYAKDGQIETLQAQLTQLHGWRDQVTLALKREGGARFEDVPGHVTALRDERDRLREAHATDVANSLVPFQIGDWIRFKWFSGEADAVVTGYKQGTLLFRSEEAGEGFMELQNITGHISKQYRAALTPAAGGGK